MPRGAGALQDWREFLDRNFVDPIARRTSFALEDLQGFRSRLYEVLISCVSPDEVFCRIAEGLVMRLHGRPELCFDIVREACRYQQSCGQGNKEIFHLEAFVFRACQLVASDAKKIAAEAAGAGVPEEAAKAPE